MLTYLLTYLLEAKAGQVLREDRADDHLVEVDRAGDEGRDRVVAERRPGGPLHHFPVELRVFLDLTWAELFFAEPPDFRVQLRNVELSPVRVVGLLDAFARELGLEVVVGVGVVEEPVGPAGVEALPITPK